MPTSRARFPRARLRRVLVTGLVIAATTTTVFVSPARALLTKVTADWPSSTLTTGSPAKVTGRVTGLEVGDGVFLQQKVLGGWDNVARADVENDGDYKVRVPTWWTGERTYRVATTSLLDSTTLGAKSADWTVQIKPAYKPAGRAGHHSYSLSAPTRWDPCTVIGYRVNKRQATKGWGRDVRGALRRISEGTGYRFVFRGRTGKFPQSDSNSWYPNDTQLVIAWAKPAQSSLLRKYPGAAGVGAALSSGGYYNGDGTSTYRIKKGMVVIDSRYKRKAGFGRGYTRGELLMHEVGHAMGLSHVGASKQIMYPYMTKRKARFGKGDLTGMQKRGAKLGCVVAAPPTASRVTGHTHTAPKLVVQP